MSQPARSAPRKKSIVPPLLLGIAVVAILGGGAWWWTARKGEAADSAYRTATIERGDIRVAISATGTLSAISTVTVGSQISGQVTDVLVDYRALLKTSISAIIGRRP